MKIIDAIKKGELEYNHHFIRSQTSEETCIYVLSAPKAMLTLAEKAPNAEIVTFGDTSLGVLIDEQIWAKERQLHGDEYIKLNEEFWRYCYLALGKNGDSFQ